MRAVIKHELPGRIRLHFNKTRFSFREADALQFYLNGFDYITKAVIYERTADATIFYTCKRDEVIKIIKEYSSDRVIVPESFFNMSSRELNSKYYEKIITGIVWHYGKRLILPPSVRAVLTGLKALRYFWRGIKTIPDKKLKVELLDAVAISASVFTNDFSTASSVMFLLDIGDDLEEWTHKQCVDDLARQMALNISRVWKDVNGTEVPVDADEINVGDSVIVRMGNIIPFDGVVTAGDAMVNQASMTGESVPVRKEKGISVFAGTVVEEGEITIRVSAVSGGGRFDRIVKMIEESEKLKSGLESKAERLADRLVPYTFVGAALAYLLGGGVTKAISVLMVDYSCALKLAMPISVLSAIREAGDHYITVKGGRFLEAVSEAEVIVFDKTGTLTKAQPSVKDIISFNGESKDELLREAACLEEHFPHSIAGAVVREAENRGLDHDEFHTKVDYIVAHGISSTIDNNRALIGSYHFVFEDEKVCIPKGKESEFNMLPDEYSHLYYAKNGELAAVILIEDPIRAEARVTIEKLHDMGISDIVMMTGDNEKTARLIAAEVGVDEYHAEVLPEDKSRFVDDKKKNGYKVIMIGDGINDSPALSAADVGIAINEGAEIARQIADITVGSDNIASIVVLKEISDRLMKRIRFNYRAIVGFNTGLIALGLAGLINPSTSALLHNASTIILGLNSTTKLMKDKQNEVGDCRATFEWE